MHIKLRQLRYFKAVVDFKTIAAAAEQLHIAQPPLSRQIRQLEQEWGLELFERTQQRLTLTEAGRHLYRRASELLSLSDDVDEEMMALGRGNSGRIRVGTVATGIERLVAAVKDLHAVLPDVRFSFHQGEPLLLERQVHDRELDLAIVQQPVEMPNLAILPLVALHFAVVFPRYQNLEAPITLEKLAAYPLLLLRRNSRFGAFEQIMRRFHALGLRPRIIAECSDVPIIERMVQAGIAIAVLPVCAGEGDLFQSPELRQALVADLADEHNTLALVHKADVSLNPVTQRLYDLLVPT